LSCGSRGNIGKALAELLRLNSQVLAYLVNGPFRVIAHDLIGSKRWCVTAQYDGKQKKLLDGVHDGYSTIDDEICAGQSKYGKNPNWLDYTFVIRPR
jgi:hypothetical protein